MAVERTGLVAVFETEQFQKGLDIYLKGLKLMGAATEDTQEKIKKSGDETKNVGEKAAGIQGIMQRLGTDFGKISKQAGPFSGLIGKIGSGLTSLGGASAPVLALGASLTVVIGIVAAAAAAFVGFIAVTVKAAKAFVNFVAEAAAEAPKLEGIGTAFENNARKFNLSLQEMRLAAAGTISDFELMRQANVALTGASGEFAQQFGKQLPTLLEGARAAAKATGQDVDFLFESLVTGVKRSSPLLIDNTGIVLKLGEANEAMAESLGIAVDDLTEEEKQLALLNATVAASIELSEQMDSSQRSAAENTAAAEANIQNFKDTLGQFMIPVLQKVSSIWADFTGVIAESIQEGGFLFPIITEIAARLSLLADVAKIVATSLITGFRNIATIFANISGNVGRNIEDLIVDFATWGAEMMAALADGIIKGASAALTAAMNVVQNLLGFWLAPGSPPRVAPNIGKWGAATFTEYMKGFSDADFGVLKGLQSVLGKILDAPELQAITLDIGTAIGEGGPDEEFFSKLGAAAGDFGAEVTELARNYFELADAQTEAEMAQSQLNDAMKAMSEAEITVNNLTRQYNDLLRAGASDEILDAQLAQIKASEEQLTLASEQKAQAEENVKTTEERLKALAEETGLQEELVNQLLALAAEEEKASKAEKEKQPKEKKGKVEREVSELGAGIGGALGEGITTGIQDAIENAKKLLLEKLGRIFAPLRRRWEQSIKPTLEDLLERFQEFRESVAIAWEELQERIQPVIDTLINWWEVQIPDAIETIKRVIDTTLMPAFRRVWNFVKDNLIPKIRELAEDIFGKLEMAIENIKEFLTGENGLVAAFASLRSFIVDKLINTLNTFRTQYIQPLVDAFDSFREILETVNNWLLAIKSTIEWILNNEDDIEFGNDSFGETTGTGTTGKGSSSFAPVVINIPLIPQAATVSGDTNNFNFGGNQINDAIDIASFQALIRQVIREELG